MPVVEHRAPQLDTAMRRIKEHIRKHKTLYSFAAGGVVVGSAFYIRGLYVPNVSIAPVFNNMPVITNSNDVHLGGHMIKIIRCVETGDYLGPMTEAAEKLGITLQKLSKHCNNYPGYDHINGLHYEIAALGLS